MDQRAKTLIEQGDKLFQQRIALLSLWQEVADHFYPERADFTLSRSLGTDFAAHLTTSYPVLARRELGNSLSAMLRPKEEPWFAIRASREELEDEPARRWLEWATGTQKRAMYDPVTQFTRATKEGDHDFAAFGQCALTVELDRRTMALLYRGWHLRDVAWKENYAGKIDCIHRKGKMTAVDMVKLFKNAHPKVKSLVDENQGKGKYDEIEYRHIVIPSEDYEGDRRQPFRSVYIDVANEHVMEDVGAFTSIYVIPRWQTVSGSQYAFSPATVAALPDARLIQAMTLSLLEAGEKAANPPMIATQEAVRSDLDLRSGGVTWLDSDYDERLGEALRPISQDYGGINYGLEMNDRVAAIIKEAFFLNQISPLPMTGNKEMTAFEVGQHIQDYIRKALPLFEPMEADYNGGLCDRTFEILMRNGAFGSVRDIPDSIRGDDVQFRFASPLHDLAERKKGNLLLEARTLTLTAAELDPSAASMLNAREALRDALKGISTPAKWMRSDEEVQAAADAMEAKQQAAEVLAGAESAAAAAADFGKAKQAFEPAVAA